MLVCLHSFVFCLCSVSVSFIWAQAPAASLHLFLFIWRNVFLLVGITICDIHRLREYMCLILLMLCKGQAVSCDGDFHFVSHWSLAQHFIVVNTKWSKCMKCNFQTGSCVVYLSFCLSLSFQCHHGSINHYIVNFILGKTSYCNSQTIKQAWFKLPCEITWRNTGMAYYFFVHYGRKK